jgi:integrase
MFTKQVLPTLGKRQLNSLRRGDLESWAGRLTISARFARQAAQYLSTMLEAAVGDGYLAVNPARGAKRPHVDESPVVPFTADEIVALRAAAPGWFVVALDLGLGAGLRQSEATGLTVDRVDWLRRSLTVDRQLVTVKSGGTILGPPKTSRSYRKVPLADAVVEALARHLEKYGPGENGCCCTALTAARCAVNDSGSSGATYARTLACRRRGFTTRDIPMRRCFYRVAFRSPPQRSIWATPPRCCSVRTRILITTVRAPLCRLRSTPRVTTVSRRPVRLGE